MTFQNPTPQAGLSLTLGTEVTHPRDVAVSYATLANGGVSLGYTHILNVTSTEGEEIIPQHQPTPLDTVISPQAAYVMTDVLASNTDPRQNEIWGDFALQGTGGRRPATLKTGTSQDANDLVAFGYVAPPDPVGRTAGEYALVVGAWAGNSDGSPALTPENPVLSTDVAAPMWHGFLQEVTGNWPVHEFARPAGVVDADVDAWSGGRPTQFTTQTRARGVHRRHGAGRGHDQGRNAGHPQPGRSCRCAARARRRAGCSGSRAAPGRRRHAASWRSRSVEPGHPDWQRANQDWIARAKQGHRCGRRSRPRGEDTRQATSSTELGARTAGRGARRSCRPTRAPPSPRLRRRSRRAWSQRSARLLSRRSR